MRWRKLHDIEAEMAVDAQELFAHLAEKERRCGHHSPEGRAMRMLSRALNGWSAELLGVYDVIILCDQAIGDWLKARLGLSPWAPSDVPNLLARAAEQAWLKGQAVAPLLRIHRARLEMREGCGGVTRAEAEASLLFCIDLINEQWQPPT